MNPIAPKRSPTPPPIGGVLRERHDLLQRRGERRRERRVAANGAGAVEFEPRIETAEVEVMSTLGHHPEHLRILVLAQTYGAGGVIPRGVPVELEPGVGVYDGLVEPHRDAGLGVVVVLRHEDDAGQDDAVGGGGGGGVGGGGLAAGAVGAAAEGGEEEEEAEGYGNGVAKAEVGEVGVRVRGGDG
ncbi:hypothetical protein CR513_45146, partial [Mucuna pruriens]